MKHYQLTIIGKVQGVWYRASTQQKAQKLGLAGFVKNQPDKSVYVEVEGDEAALKEFIDWCREGPPLAKVNQVKMQEEALKNFKKFEVQR